MSSRLHAEETQPGGVRRAAASQSPWCRCTMSVRRAPGEGKHDATLCCSGACERHWRPKPYKSLPKNNAAQLLSFSLDGQDAQGKREKPSCVVLWEGFVGDSRGESAIALLRGL